MWGIEHTSMAVIGFSAVVACALVFKSRLDALGATLTQVPFWAGSFAFFAGNPEPLYTNMIADVSIAFALLFLAHLTGRNQFAWLCVVCVGMILVDVFAGFTQMPFYLELHEGLHYTALVVAMGGKYVRLLSLPPSAVLRFARAR